MPTTKKAADGGKKSEPTFQSAATAAVMFGIKMAAPFVVQGKSKCCFTATHSHTLSLSLSVRVWIDLSLLFEKFGSRNLPLREIPRGSLSPTAHSVCLLCAIFNK